MKTNFALGLTQDGITLWQRDGSGWLRVGAVALDNPDIDAAMAAVVDKAHKLAPDGVSTKLVIPEEHLLLTNIHAPGPGPDAQEAQIRAGLAGRTPFPVEELVFDWSGAGTNVAVAVVARETLIEAEEFAIAQGLNPVAFVAATAPDGFRGEPFLGVTRAARATGIEPKAVVRDGAVLRETGIARLPEPPKSAPAPAPAPAAKDTADDAADPKSKIVPDTAQPDTVGPDVAKPDTATTKATNDTTTEKPTSTATTSPSAPIVAPKDAGTPASPRSPIPQTPAVAVPPALLDAKPKESLAADAADTAPSIGFRTRRQNGSAQPAIPQIPTAKAANGPAPARGALPEPLSQLGEKLRARYGKTNAAVATQFGALRAALSRSKDSAAADTKLALTADAGKGAASPLLSKIAPKPEATAPRPSALSALTERAGKTAAKAATPPQSAARQNPLDTLRKLQEKPITPPTSATSADEAQRMTVFGARATASENGKPPLPHQALLISGGVLLVLISAAIWAFYFMAAAPDRADTAEAPVISTPDVVAPPPLPEDVAESQEATELAAIEAALGQSDAAQTDRLAEDGSEGGASGDVVGSPVTTQAEESALTAPSDAATDTVQAPPSDVEAGRVAEIRSNGIVAPQDLSGTLPTPVPPAPFGADPLPPLRGTPEAQALLGSTEGAPVDTAPADALPDLTDEITAAVTEDAGPQLPAGEEALDIGVTEGSPPSTPPAKPARFTQPEAPEPEATEPDAPAQQDAAAEQGTAPDPAAPLSEEDLEIRVTEGAPAVVPPRRVDPDPSAPPAEQDDAIPPQGSLLPPADSTEAPAATQVAATTTLAPPLGGVALSALRPAARPSDLRRPAEPPEVSETSFANATAQAVESSVRPNSRPAEFAQVVQRALRAATTRQATNAPPAAEAIQTAAAAAMPRLPTSTSVAREATVSRAINLRQVNLLGVMGTSSNRRALVRLSNGRVVTVRVGERLDDGQVTAIGDSELRYVRGGRDVVLRIAS